MIKHYGNWHRSPKQCRDRWINGIDPNIVNKKWTDEEEKILFEKHKIFGNKWCTIASFLYGRSGNAIKNHFYSIIRKNIRKYNKKRVFGDKILEDIPELLKKPKFYSILVKPAKVRPKKIKVKKIVILDGKKHRGRPKKEKKPKEKKTEVQIESENLVSLPNIFQNNSVWTQNLI